MDRFVALLWNPQVGPHAARVADLRAALERQPARWLTVLDVPGLWVSSLLQRGAEPVATRMDGGAGVLIGTVFERGGESRGRIKSLNTAETQRVVATGGEHLVTSYWGNYVALWRDTKTGATIVQRDPCGGVPCFTTRTSGVDLLFSHAGDIADLPGVTFSVDWRFIQSFLLNNYFSTPFTGLKEVTEVLPGQRMTLEPGREPNLSWAWDGVAIAASARHRRFEEAKAELRETVAASLTAWGKAYDSLVVRLSGGLDSTILLNVLRQSSTARLTAMHLTTNNGPDRERDIAQLAATHADVELVEIHLDSATRDLHSMLGAPRLARPTKQIMGIDVDALAGKVCADVSADGIIAGHGGDGLFIQRSGAQYMFADYLRQRGLGKDFWRTAYSTSMLLECSIWHVIGDAIAHLSGRRKWSPYPHLENTAWMQQRLVRGDALAALPKDYILHPWLSGATKLPPGKASQLRSVVALRNYHAVLGSGLTRDALMPFFSQPIVAFALRTPAYIFGEGGRDRALERSAFADAIPDRIARRVSKGLVDHHLLDVTRRNLSFLRELVLDGALVATDRIARERVERALRPDQLDLGRGMDEIYNMVVVEAWLRSWRAT